MTDTNELLRDLERALVASSGPYRYQPTTSLPALSPQMQAALDAEAQMVAMVLKRARDMEAELQAARADLREAISLLRNTDWEKDNWDERYEALLAKHKEATDG